MASKQFTLQVVNQEGIVFYGNCNVLFVPGERDVVAIMAYHEPMIMKLGPGDVIIREGRKTRTLATVKHGVVYVGENEVSAIIT